MKLALALAMFGVADASYPEIAGYAPGSDVVPHAKIDLSAKAMSNFLGSSDGNKDYGGTVVALDKTTMFGAAKHIYDTGCQSSSYVSYTFAATANMLMANTKKDYLCKVIDGALGTDKYVFSLGKLDKTTTASSTSIKIKFDGAMSAACGMVPLDGVAAYVAAYSEPTCPIAAYAVDSISCSCVACATAETARTAVLTAGKFGGRSLKGFSTKAPGKLDGMGSDSCDISGHTTRTACETNNGFFTPAAPSEDEFMQAKGFHGESGTYADDHVQLALNALTVKQNLAILTPTFSACAVPGSGTGATDYTCASGFVQGNAICKATDSRALSIPVGADWATQAANCVAGGGKVTDFWSKSEAFSIEVAKKMAVYANAWMYTLHEFEDAIYDCRVDKIDNNDDSVHAWDEGVAFYTGSLAETSSWVGAVQTGKSGSMIYALANKRCANFGTCTEGEEGNSNVNVALLTEFTNGQWSCKVKDCDQSAVVLERIKSLMRIPLIQGTLRYAYKMGELDAGASGKEPGEGYAFMMSIVHAVAKCDLNDALTIYNALDMPDGAAFSSDATFADIKTAFENNYACMGITCDDVGELKSSVEGHGGVYPGAEACHFDHDHDEDEDDEDLPQWALIAIIGAGAVAVIFIVISCFVYSSKESTRKLYENLQKQQAGSAASK